MNPSYIQSLIYNNVQTVKIKLIYNRGVQSSLGAKKLTYKTKLRLQVGDKVICPVISSTNLLIGQVIKIDQWPNLDKDAPFEYKWITQKIDQEKINLSFEIDQKFKEELERQLFEKEKNNLDITDQEKKLLKDTEFTDKTL